MANFCPNCGTALQEHQDVCLNCGKVVNNSSRSSSSVVENGSVAGWTVLGFFIPLAGLILYLIWQNERPLASKAAGKGALIGVIASVVLSIIYVIILVVAFGSFYMNI